MFWHFMYKRKTDVKTKCVGYIPFVPESQWPSPCNIPYQSLLLNYWSCPESWRCPLGLTPGTVRSPLPLHSVAKAWGPAAQTGRNSQQIFSKVFETLNGTSRWREKVAGDRSRAASRQTSPWQTLSFASKCRTLSLTAEVPFWLLVMGIIFGRECVNQTDAAGK